MFLDFDMKENDKNACLDIIIHACDISNPIKPYINNGLIEY